MSKPGSQSSGSIHPKANDAGLRSKGASKILKFAARDGDIEDLKIFLNSDDLESCAKAVCAVIRNAHPMSFRFVSQTLRKADPRNPNLFRNVLENAKAYKGAGKEDINLNDAIRDLAQSSDIDNETKEAMHEAFINDDVFAAIFEHELVKLEGAFNRAGNEGSDE